jgi:glycosyltransferase involved in cell wall biosynthesis
MADGAPATPRAPPGQRAVIARGPLGSVVIPAFDEAGVIQRTLDALFTGIEPGELEVVIVCNGCGDDTASVARASGHSLRVRELQPASKPAALRCGDSEARAFPRLYLDADVVLPGSAARLVLERLRFGALAARPPVRYAVSDASAPVRSYYRARSRVPAVLGSLWGAGVYGLSAAGRDRFGPFPDVVADDLWVDRLFSPDEVEIVDSAPAVVTVPRRSRDLVRVLARTYRGKRERAVAADLRDRAPQTLMSTLRDLGRFGLAGPAAALDAATYAAFAAGARLTLAVPHRSDARIAGERWERDDSSRVA